MKTLTKLKKLLNGEEIKPFFYKVRQLNALPGWNFDIDQNDGEGGYEENDEIQISLYEDGHASFCVVDHEENGERCDDSDLVINQIWDLEKVIS